VNERRYSTVYYGRSVQLSDWIESWKPLARYPGEDGAQIDARIAAVIERCEVSVDPSWPRPHPEDHLWAAGHYRRGDRGAPSGPEREVEHQILGPDALIAVGRVCCGGRVIDAINAIPLTRRPKIEADVLLLVDHGDELRQYLAEVKKSADDPWYATVELLRQLRLLAASSHAGDYFHRKDQRVPAGVPVTGLVVAPKAYYANHDLVERTQRLVDAVRHQTALDVRLAVWDTERAQITEHER
jgi:hypothetical protein